MKNKLNIPALLLAMLLLSGCSSFEGVFSGDKLPPLPGERISILQLQQELTPSAELQKTPIVLPVAWTNTFWPQAGGYPNHAMGHLTLGKDLKEVWSVSIGAGGDRRDPLIAQPVAADGMVFTLDTDARVTAFNLADGEQKWRVSTVPPGEEDSGYIGGGLAYSGKKLYVTNGYKQLACIDPATGSIVWRVTVPSPARAAPTVAEGKVYLITLDNRLMVFSKEDGAPLWNYEGITETTNLLGSVSPAVDASLVVLPLSSGQVFGLRIENGQAVWEDNLSAVRRIGALSAIADIRGQPVIDQGLVYAASYSGRMVAIDEISGQRVWQREIGSAETPWAAGDTVFVLSTDQQLLALTRQKGDLRWISSLPRFEGKDKDKPIIWTGPVLAGGRLILASSRGQMIEVNPADGVIMKQSDLPGDVMIAPLVADNTLFFLTEQGKLVAYR
ncbi:MAG: PQQ-binding-like beta-propeller repeat protein [Alphaproteobacteria bacterium]|nr:PQQ-binding-like beta-propeller repeat protein [Alphaproteobacteria bacterium]